METSIFNVIILVVAVAIAAWFFTKQSPPPPPAPEPAPPSEPVYEDIELIDYAPDDYEGL